MNAPRNIMPPPFTRIMPRPAIPMDEDARLCNTAMKRATGGGNVISSEAKDRRAREVRVRREAHQASVLAHLTTSPATVREIMTACHLSDHVARECLLALHDAGKAVKQDGHMRYGKAVWGVCNVA